MNSKTLENIYNECLEIANMIKNPTLKKCCKNIYIKYIEIEVKNLSLYLYIYFFIYKLLNTKNTNIKEECRC